MVANLAERIQVTITTEYRSDISTPEAGIYVFAYTVRIENNSPATVKLLNRHWFVTDGRLHRREVEGKGVVGEQPVLKPGDHFVYTSGCDFRSEFGRMYGFYEMLNTDTDNRFDLRIPDFILTVPYKLN